MNTKPVLWPALISEWQLMPDEVVYIDRQQGACCAGCGANLRSQALARTVFPLMTGNARILEINEAGMLSACLRRWPHYTRADYPGIDMQALPHLDASFDLVVHSDTLEHVADPIRGLAECRRVLAPAGICCFTVPMIVGRLTRLRAGMSPSYHGDGRSPDMLVHTEYGADCWTHCMRAGFSRVTIDCLEYPAAIAISAHA